MIFGVKRLNKLTLGIRWATIYPPPSQIYVIYLIMLIFPSVILPVQKKICYSSEFQRNIQETTQTSLLYVIIIFYVNLYGNPAFSLDYKNVTF